MVLRSIFSVQLNWHKDDRDGRFLLRSLSPDPVEQIPESKSFKRSFSVRMKKVFAKERKPNENETRNVLEKSTPEHGGLRRSMTNPDSVLDRRKIQKPFKPSPLRLRPVSSSDEDSGFASGQLQQPSILVKIHSDLSARNIPLLVVRLAPLDTTEQIMEHVTTKYGLPAGTARDCGLGLSGTRELLAPGDRPYILLINNPGSVLTLRRRHPHQRSSQSGSSNYSDLGSLGRGQGQWSPPWHETEQTVFRVRIRRCVITV